MKDIVNELKILYHTVYNLDNNRYLCISNNTAYVQDDVGNIYLSIDTQIYEIQVQKSIIVLYDNNNNNDVRLYSSYNDSYITIQYYSSIRYIDIKIKANAVILGDSTGIKKISDKFGKDILDTSNIDNNGTIILNERLECIFVDRSYKRLSYRISYRKEQYLVCKYSIFGMIRQCELVIDTVAKRVVYYDTYSIDNELYVWATSECKEHLVYSNNALEYYKYRLVVNGVAISEEYDEIVKVTNIKNKKLIKVRNNNKVGIIDIYGKEIVPCIYDDIELLSEKAAFIQKDKNKNIYWFGASEIFDDKNIIDIKLHETLPLAVIFTMDMQVYCFDYRDSSVFNFNELSKHFNIEMYSNDNTILRINIGSITKYTTNRLEPITNVPFISSIANNEWIHI